MIRALVECDSLGRARLRELTEYRSGKHFPPPQVTLRGNVLTATSALDSMAVYLTIRDRCERHFSAEAREEVRTVEVNRLTRWQKAWMRLGQIVALLLALWAAWRIARIVR